MANNTSLRQNGFTVIELIISIAFLMIAGILVAWQFNNLRVAARDDQQKTAINSVYYGLEEVFHKENGYYPETISNDTLRSVDPELLTDPFGVKIGDNESTYRYEPAECLDGKCQRYSLRANLENESDYVKTSK